MLDESQSLLGYFKTFPAFCYEYPLLFHTLEDLIKLDYGTYRLMLWDTRQDNMAAELSTKFYISWWLSKTNKKTQQRFSACFQTSQQLWRHIQTCRFLIPFRALLTGTISLAEILTYVPLEEQQELAVWKLMWLFVLWVLVYCSF